MMANKHPTQIGAYLDHGVCKSLGIQLRRDYVLVKHRITIKWSSTMGYMYIRRIQRLPLQGGGSGSQRVRTHACNLVDEKGV